LHAKQYKAAAAISAVDFKVIIICFKWLRDAKNYFFT